MTVHHNEISRWGGRNGGDLAWASSLDSLWHLAGVDSGVFLFFMIPQPVVMTFSRHCDRINMGTDEGKRGDTARFVPD